jgi:hypothetical protein
MMFNFIGSALGIHWAVVFFILFVLFIGSLAVYIVLGASGCKKRRRRCRPFSGETFMAKYEIYRDEIGATDAEEFRLRW